ncbi:unnamed protein product [Rotaria magnacalcarata]|uniref:Uncharacterized protein n=1 Tax=Rotaria magnacalcarata TaxID=392030 RepID=A0A8S3GEY3_9BILA|nr:unnamed protein product [Rotaria magnacalcarata]
MNISLVEGQCLDGKLPDTVNVAIQTDGTQVHERYATKQNDFDEKRIRIISKSSLNQEILDVLLGSIELGSLATVGLQPIYVYDKLCVVVLSNE